MPRQWFRRPDAVFRNHAHQLRHHRRDRKPECRRLTLEENGTSCRDDARACVPANRCVATPSTRINQWRAPGENSATGQLAWPATSCRVPGCKLPVSGTTNHRWNGNPRHACPAPSPIVSEISAIGVLGRKAFSSLRAKLGEGRATLPTTRRTRPALPEDCCNNKARRGSEGGHRFHFRESASGSYSCVNLWPGAEEITDFASGAHVGRTQRGGERPRRVRTSKFFAAEQKNVRLRLRAWPRADVQIVWADASGPAGAAEEQPHQGFEIVAVLFVQPK